MATLVYLKNTRNELFKIYRQATADETE